MPAHPLLKNYLDQTHRQMCCLKRFKLSLRAAPLVSVARSEGANSDLTAALSVNLHFARMR